MAVSGTTGRVFFLTFAELAQVTDVDMAKQHFAAANGYYQRGEYEKAIEEFSKAYDLSKKAELFFNIAVCYEKMSKFEEALTAYRRYLAEMPWATDRQEVEARISLLEKETAWRKFPDEGDRGLRPLQGGNRRMRRRNLYSD